MAISKNLIEQIKNSVLISDIIAKFLPLKKRGVNYFTKCPFHNEKTPSFCVNNTKKIFYCFGCHEKGDIFTFLMKFKNITYPEAIKEIANIVGISIKNESYEKISAKTNIENTALKINNLACSIYHQNIKNSPAFNYILKRGLDEHDINKFKLGYAPENWDFIYKQLIEKNYREETLLYTNLIIKSENNTFYDRFRNKLIFPIFNELDQVIGFGSRVLDNSLPKYINSPESSFFQKRKILYGLNLAKNHFKQKKFVIITEGYFDVIACHKYGFDTAVATLGTALTKEHLSILARYDLNHLYFVFDADEPGINACFKAISIASDFNFSISVINLVDGMDPMDFLLQLGRDEFLKQIKNALPPIDFVINSVKKKFDLNKPETRINFIRHIFSYLKTINNAILKDEFLKRLSEETNINESLLREEYSKGEKNDYYVIKKLKDESVHEKREKTLLFLILANENLFLKYIDKISYNFFKLPFCQKIIKVINERYNELNYYDFSEFIKAIEMVLDDNEEKIYFFNEIMKDVYIKKADIQIEILFYEIKLEKIEEMLNENIKNISTKEKNGDIENLFELQKAQQFLSLQRLNILKALKNIKKF